MSLRDCSPKYSLFIPFLFCLSSSLSLCPCPWSHLGYLIFFFLFFQRLYQLSQASFLWHDAECLQLGAECLETKGLQQVELWWLDQRLRACTTSSKGPLPGQSLPHLLVCLHPRGAGGCLLQWSHAQQPKRPKLQPWVHQNRRPSLTCPPTPKG